MLFITALSMAVVMNLFSPDEHGRQPPFSKTYGTERQTAYDRYDNYDAIEVPFYGMLFRSDYDGVMGVYILFD